MKNRNAKLSLTALACVALIVACGGGGGPGAQNAPVAGPGVVGDVAGDIGASVPALMAFMNRQVAADENADLVDINALALAQDDAADLVPVAL